MFLTKVGFGTLAQAIGSQKLEWCYRMVKRLPATTASHALPLVSHRFNKKLDADDAKVVAYLVSVSTVLTELDVGGNAIGDLGVAAIAQALPFSPALTVVSFGANTIGDAGAVALGEALRVNTVLTTVSLGGNSIGDNPNPNRNP